MSSCTISSMPWTIYGRNDKHCHDWLLRWTVFHSRTHEPPIHPSIHPSTVWIFHSTPLHKPPSVPCMVVGRIPIHYGLDLKKNDSSFFAFYDILDGDSLPFYRLRERNRRRYKCTPCMLSAAILFGPAN